MEKSTSIGNIGKWYWQWRPCVRGFENVRGIIRSQLF